MEFTINAYNLFLFYVFFLVEKKINEKFLISRRKFKESKAHWNCKITNLMFYIFRCVKEMLTYISDAMITTIFMIHYFLRGFERTNMRQKETIYIFLVHFRKYFIIFFHSIC